MIQSYRDLVAWQKAMDLVETIYHLSKQFPKEELYGLTSQIRRAAISIPSNVAEGHARLSKGEFCQFIGHARGSLAEVSTQVLLALRLGFIKQSDADIALASADEVGRILNGLLASLRK